MVEASADSISIEFKIAKVFKNQLDSRVMHSKIPTILIQWSSQYTSIVAWVPPRCQLNHFDKVANLQRFFQNGSNKNHSNAGHTGEYRFAPLKHIASVQRDLISMRPSRRSNHNIHRIAGRILGRCKDFDGLIKTRGAIFECKHSRCFGCSIGRLLYKCGDIDFR